jgi:hypothetical protein
LLVAKFTTEYISEQYIKESRESTCLVLRLAYKSNLDKVPIDVGVLWLHIPWKPST